MKALIDADSLLYKVGFAIEEKTIWNEFDVEAGLEDSPDITHDTNIQQCYSTFDVLMDNIMFATDADEALLVFSGGKNFRLDFPVSYKENRKDSRKPLGYKELLQYADDNYDCIITNGIEADDLVVYMKGQDDDYTLCAIDKDILYQTIGTHYNYGKDEWITTKEFDAIWFAYYQTLTGDTSDGYKGCKGIGDKRARKILADCKTEKELWDAVVETYLSKDQTEEEAIWTMRLANMHQWNGEEIVLWNPPE
jgi:5'-3' exonuclease